MRRVTPLLPALFLLLALPACDSVGEEPNKSPVASFSFTPNSPRAGTEVSFANQSSDSDGQIESYSWDFDGDGAEDDSGRNPSFTFQEEGTHTVSLTVTDDRGGTASTSEAINVSVRFNAVTITRVAIEEMPFSNDQGAGWDVSSGPDVYYEVYDENDEVAVSKDTYYENIGPSDLPVSWNEDYTISELGEEHAIYLWDYDPANADDGIGGIAFTPNGGDGNYPQTISLDAGGITLGLRVEWSFESSSGSPATAGADHQSLVQSAQPAPPPQPVEKERTAQH